MKWLILIVLVGVTACKPDAETRSSSNNAPATAAQTAAQESEEKPDVWAMEVAGQPELAGSSVERKETAEGAQVVTFFGAPAMLRLDLSQTGALVSLKLRHSQEGVTCIFEQGRTSTKLDFGLTDNRGELDGEVLCGPTDKGEEAMMPTKLSGWFEAPLKKLPERIKATDFRPGKGQKIKITKDGPEVTDE